MCQFNPNVSFTHTQPANQTHCGHVMPALSAWSLKHCFCGGGGGGGLHQLDGILIVKKSMREKNVRGMKKFPRAGHMHGKQP